MRGFQFYFLLFLTAWLLNAAPVRAAEPIEIPRKVIAFYNPDDIKDLSENAVHRHLEVVLNYFGLDVSYYSINDPLPSDDEIRGVRGVVSWLFSNSAVKDPATYCTWMSNQMAKGIKWVALERLGIFNNNQEDLPPSCVQALGDLGMEYAGDDSTDELFLEVAHQDPRMVEFERKLSLFEDPHYALIHLKAVDTHSYLSLRRTDIENSESPLVFTTPRGGYAHAGFVLFENKVIKKSQWRLNPWLFFKAAFALDGEPRPDISTENGRRLFMTHIDGDGIFNVSNIDRKSFSGEIIAREILEKNPELPFSVSIITGYLDTPEYLSERTTSLYKDLFAPDNIEAAAHGHAHPLVWRTGKVALNVPGYTYSAKYEISGSVDRLRGLLKSLGIAKPVDVFFWTGDCLPTTEQIAYANGLGLLSINGGDARFDHIFDSASFLFPAGLMREGERQIYAAFPNENVFTNLWHGPYYGFRDIVESFQNTETPLRLKPIDIYYHYYSGERQASFKALESAYDYAKSQPILPVFISEYIRAALDFYGEKIFALPSGGWRILNDGSARTVRFDDTQMNVDLKKSSGVIGFKHEHGSLYVHLDEGKTHEVYLTAAKPQQPYLIDASFHVKNFLITPDGVQFAKRGWLKSTAVFGGLVPGKTYTYSVGSETGKVNTDKDGVAQMGFRSIEKNGTFVEVSLRLESIKN